MFAPPTPTGYVGESVPNEPEYNMKGNQIYRRLGLRANLGSPVKRLFARVPHPLCVSKGGGLDSTTTGNVEMDGPKIPTLAKTARMGHPAEKLSKLHRG
jgi:hypothetical protein